jgi:hypothetical protein
MKKLILIVCVTVPLAGLTQEFSMDWFKISGGGGSSTNSQYLISGTVGQPDANGPMAANNYSLTGGFWSLLAAVQTPGAPYLQLARTSSNSICVWWAVSDTSWELQATANLMTTGTFWTACSYVTNGANCIYIESPSAGKKFYRLKQP